MEIVTYFDSNYLDVGVCMIESLRDQEGRDLVFRVLCLDKKSFDYVSEEFKEDPNFFPYLLEDLEKKDPVLLSLKHQLEGMKSYQNQNFNFSNKQKYIWVLTPYFCNYVLKNLGSKEILYCDADLYFYENLDSVRDEVKDYSIGIVTHMSPHHLTGKTPSGIYNVGIVYFKNDESGMACSEFWKSLLMNPNNQYYQRYGTCGDQKYLELFEGLPKHGKRVRVIKGKVAYGAPWCWGEYTYLNKKDVIYMGEERRIIFNHFSSIKIWEDGYDSFVGASSKPTDFSPYIKEYYDDYYQKIIERRRKINSTL